ncbi:TIGR03751 family conjugal transfer lipoprotein [Kineobactrum sediminis]|uniref:TIGR03751 family conjugal transfer lipoprotein n=2 Tax=Kineobactrum sediminis TaxID=1905677 RepID=A0A2N5Y4M4_9GAMM|nr:TIGR03751 family conjugal transfer lipoprotein [Kineobactrum sediminis]
MIRTLSISLLLAGCASSKDTILPQDGPTMREIYNAHVRTSEGEDRRTRLPTAGLRAPGHHLSDLGTAAQADYEALSARFTRVANPTLVMYIFPHLAGVHRVPVPGYSTVFPLYERVEYALPGEHTQESP